MNGYLQLFFAIIAVGGIVWNAAVLHNDVKHIKKDLEESREERGKLWKETSKIMDILLKRDERSP